MKNCQKRRNPAQFPIKTLGTKTVWVLLGAGLLFGCGSDDDEPTPDESQSPGSPSPVGDDDASGDDDATSGDDDISAGDDDASAGDDDGSSGDDDASAGDDDQSGDDDASSGDDDESGDDDASSGDDDISGDDDATDEGSPTASETPSPTPIEFSEPQPGDIVISEVMVEPRSVTDNLGEYLEVTNTSDSRWINLNGWQISDGTQTHTIARDLPIGPGAFCVLGRNENAETNGNISIDYQYTQIEISGKTAFGLSLRYETLVMDSVQFDWQDGAFISLDGHSVELDETRSHVDANDDGASWCAAFDRMDGTSDYGTPGKKNGICFGDEDSDGYTQEVDCDDGDASVHPETAEIPDNGRDDDCDGQRDEDPIYGEGAAIISEILYNPASVSDTIGEWFEIYNPGELDINLAGWQIGDAQETHIILEDIILPSKRYVVLGISVDIANNGGAEVDYAYPGFFLNNSTDAALGYADMVQLSYDAILIDGVVYDSGGDFESANGVSLNLDFRYTNAQNNDRGSAWCLGSSTFGVGDRGTPGSANDVCVLDFDDDSYLETSDCNDDNGTIFPGAPETCDGEDNDCDASIDEGATDVTTAYADQDNDGYGDPFSSLQICTLPNGYVTNADDCDDANSAVNPDGVESCNHKDDNCNSTADEGFDQDGDGATECGGDCDDFDSEIGPQALETCDDQDEDCDGQVDEDFDLDADGYTSCGDDCNDNDALQYPGAEEQCNGDDDNCNGLIDEGSDDDLDGYTLCQGDCDDQNADVGPTSVESCNNVDDDCDGSIDNGFDSDADRYSLCNGDCDDRDESIYPGASESCNLLDDNCDGLIDEGVDEDLDGFTFCQGDCDDQNSDANPMASEQCNGIDDNCDGDIDEDFDIDQDDVSTCAGDCDDNDRMVYPGATEVCNGIDDNCDGMVDPGYDLDRDGYSSCSGDCNDYDPAVSPAIEDTCNGLDDDCSGFADENYDLDRDGFAWCLGDCDDANPDVNPGRQEICNGFDDDCDATIDEGFDSDRDGIADCYDHETCDGVDNDGDGQRDEDFTDVDGNGSIDCSTATFCSAEDGFNVLENGQNAVETWDGNFRWDAEIDGAVWIWDAEYEPYPTTTRTVVIQRDFELAGAATAIEAELWIAADSSYSVAVDGNLVAYDNSRVNSEEADNWSLSVQVHPGVNALEFSVTNQGQTAGTQYTNPGGLLYCLELSWDLD